MRIGPPAAISDGAVGSSCVKVHYVATPTPGRSYNLVLQGLRNHPRVRLVETHEESDAVFYHHQAWNTTLRFPAEKLAFIDFHDDPYVSFPVDCAAYFKRSWPVPKTGAPRFTRDLPPRPPHVHPIAYAVMDEFICHEPLERDIDLACLLRPNQIKRRILLELLAGLDLRRFRCVLGPVNGGGRDTFDGDYLQTLRRSKIVITCNPDDAEGDSRTWEALANGPLVFVDGMYTPVDAPYVHREHCAFFDGAGIDQNPHRLKPFLDLLAHYLTNPGEAEAVARQGHAHTLAHHRTANRVDSMLRVLGL